MKAELIDISKIKCNTGQIEGLPKNPRLIKDDKYEKLLKSIQEDPEMLELRELIVFPLDNQFIAIAGNMRLKALRKLGYKDVPCKVLDKTTTVDKLKAYTIKDNLPYGEHSWEDLANEWDEETLSEWGLDIPDLDKVIKKKEELKDFCRSHVLISYHPDQHLEIQKLLEQLNNLENIEIEIASN